MKIDIEPKRAVVALILYNTTTPIIVKKTATKKATEIETLPEGIGLFFVLFITASESFSII